jgi:hypothetical protein
MTKIPIITKIQRSVDILTPVGIPHANKIRSIKYDRVKCCWVNKYSGAAIIWEKGHGWIDSDTGEKIVYKL